MTSFQLIAIIFTPRQTSHCYHTTMNYLREVADYKDKTRVALIIVLALSVLVLSIIDAYSTHHGENSHHSSGAHTHL